MYRFETEFTIVSCVEQTRMDERDAVIFVSELKAVLSSRNVLMRNKVTGRSVIVDRSVAKAAAACKTFATLEQHLCHAHLKFDGAPEVSMRMMRDALGAGLFVTRDHLSKCLRQQPAFARAYRKLDFVGIPTCNRPHMLNRVLASLTRHMEQHGRDATILVLDDSRTAAMQEANATVIANRQRVSSVPIRHVDDALREQCVVRLIRETSANPRGIRFGLGRNESFPSSAGAARNMLLLLTAGHAALFLDDDHICQVITMPEATDRIKLANRTTIRRFLSSTDEVDKILYVTEDMLELHEQMLNVDISALTWETDQLTDFQSLGADTYRRLGRQKPRIITSQMGIFGDCGMDDPLSHVLQDRSEFSGAIRDDKSYRAAMWGRQVLTGTNDFLATPRIHSQAGCLAVDNCDGLPPFLPVMRGEDVVFGLLIRICMPECLFGLLPRAIVHAPDVTREFSTGAAIQRAGHFSLAETINLLVTGSGGVWGAGCGERVRSLGKSLEQLLSAGDQELGDYLQRIIDPILIDWIHKLEQHLENSDEDAPWAEELRAIQERFLLGMDAFDPLQPYDLHAVQTEGGPPAALRAIAGGFSQFIQVWPALLDSARAHPLE